MPLVANAVPVLTNIADPDTRWRRFFASQARAAIIVAPVAAIQGELWANLDLTIAAFADVARPFLQETIRRGPEGLQTAIETFPQIRPFFRSTGRFFAELQPGARALERSAPTLASAFTKGIKGLEGSPAFNRRLSVYLRDLEAFATNPLVPIGFKDLVETVKALDPAISFITPAQTVCNYLSLFFRNAASLLSDGDQNGTWLRFMVITTPVAPDGGPAPNGEGGPSGQPANGGGRKIDNIDPNFLHVNPVPAHRCTRAGARVRGRQRDVRAGQAGDRERARQPGHRDRRAGQAEGGRRVMAAAPKTHRPAPPARPHESRCGRARSRC